MSETTCWAGKGWVKLFIHSMVKIIMLYTEHENAAVVPRLSGKGVREKD